MYLRTVRARGGAGLTHEYIRLVESYWEHGQAKQRVVANLGRKDRLAPHLDALVRLLRGDHSVPAARPTRAAVQAEQAACWGPLLVARTLWRELGLEAILDACNDRRHRGEGLPLADRVLVLVANRLCDPQSEHGLVVPQWKPRGRVRVDLTWLQRWYRTLDALLPHKARIETELFARLRDLFALEVDLVFYDLTSTYFEGAGPADFAVHGYSRDGKPRNRQVLVGVVMINGWPIAHHVFRGNRHDDQTVGEVLRDLEHRFGLRRVIFVGDRGMVTTANLATLRARRHGYLVGLHRRRREEVFALIRRATGPWLECPVGITAREQGPAPPKTLVQEVAADEPGVRIFVVHSDERAAYERAMRERDMARTRVALERLARRVATGRLRAPEKIGEAAGRILTRHHGHRYYGWTLQDGVVRFVEHPVHFAREQAFEGKYVIRTEEPHLTPVEAVQAYKELSEVERAFRELKDVIELRPIYHRRKERVQAHIFIAALAFLLDRALEKKLKAARVAMSAAEALKALRTVHVVDLVVGPTRKRGVTGGSARARQVLAALDITEREPPGSPETQAMATC
jgi:transposase